MKKLIALLIILTIGIYSCKEDRKKENTSESQTETETIVESEVEANEVIEEEEEETEVEVAKEPIYANEAVSADDPVKVKPVSHGTLILEYDKMVIYVDPVGDAEVFTDYKKPTIILVTDIHGDHLNVETLEAVKNTNTLIVVPNAVAEKLPAEWEPNVSIMANGQSNNFGIGDVDITIEAIPMYNLREEALQFHTKYRGNGYVITMNNQRIYISGDTEDIPEMRALENIDKAFVCMNLPYTMTVESAASAVLDFQPKIVYPYHYRGSEGLSDVAKFKELVMSKNQTIDVRLLNWYPNR